jgi:hypothetical protein
MWRSLAITLLVIAIGCGSDEPRAQKTVVREPASIQTAFLEDVVPLINGGAYAVGPDGVWYLSRASAIRVRPLGDSATRADFTSAVGFEVQPTVDGGAYAVELAGSIWRLEADSAMLVKEASTRSTDTTTAIRTADASGWLLYTMERRRAESSDEEGGAGLEGSDDYDYDPAERGP